MLKTVTEIICATLLISLYLYMIKKILNSKTKILTKKNIVLVVIQIIVTVVSYNPTYSIETIIMRFMVDIIIFKMIFDESLYKTTIICILILMINLVCDIVDTSIIINFYTIKEIRETPKIMFLSNITTIFLTYWIFNIKWLLSKIRIVVKNLNENNNSISLIVICTSIFILTISVLYNLINIYKLNISYLINILIIVTFIAILIIFFIDTNKYQELLREYDSLFKYIQTFENSIDKINLSNHESKNELVILRSYIKDNKKTNALKIIDDMIIDMNKQDTKILSSIKNIPKGGIKGLLYYKIVVATDKKLKVCLDISKTIKGKLSHMKINELKLICNLLGIYLDNAIEASTESSKKLIGIELYTMDNKICFVISNTFKNKKVNLEKVSKNGYTTKGKGHGKGLYLANKLITKTEWIESNTKIFNNMYIQKLIIDRKLIKN